MSDVDVPQTFIAEYVSALGFDASDATYLKVPLNVIDFVQDEKGVILPVPVKGALVYLCNYTDEKINLYCQPNTLINYGDFSSGSYTIGGKLGVIFWGVDDTNWAAIIGELIV